MAYDTLDEFTEWCYNSYVEATRSDRYREATVYYLVLHQHLTLNLKARRLVSQRIKAKSLLKDIDNAGKAGKSYSLTYTGEKGVHEFKEMIAAYEKQLRELGYSEDNITELIIQKKLEG